MKTAQTGIRRDETELISIIIPVYNAQKTLNRCIKSILSQTYTNLSIIIVDDGSTDLSGKISDQFASKDKRIRVIHQKNGGVVAARFAGIAMLPERGYSTFCDADDYLPKDALEKMYRYAIETRADIVCGNVQRFFSNIIKLPTDFPAILTERRSYDKEEISTQILPSFFGITNYPGYMPSKLYNNSLLHKVLCSPYPSIRFFQEDIAFNLQATLNADRIAVLPDVIYYYRMGGGTSGFMPSFFSDCVALYNYKCHMITSNGLSDKLKYTTDVELKNELSTWLQMYFEHVRGEKECVLSEIERCCKTDEVQKALAYEKMDCSGLPGFKELVVGMKYDDIYHLIAQNVRRNALKKRVKRIICAL